MKDEEKNRDALLPQFPGTVVSPSKIALAVSRSFLITPALPMSLKEGIYAETVFANGLGPQSHFVSSKDV